MRIAKTVSVTLPPDFLIKVQATAEKEHRTMSELVREALRQYMDANSKADREGWDRLLAYGRGLGRELGIKSEEDVERMCDEYDAEKRG